MKRRFFLAGILAIQAGFVHATGHDLDSKVKGLRVPKNFNASVILQNANMIAANAKNMTPAQLIRSWNYLKAADDQNNKNGGDVRVQAAITRAMGAVLSAWEKYEPMYGNIEEAAKKATNLADKILEDMYPPIIDRGPVDNK